MTPAFAGAGSDGQSGAAPRNTTWRHSRPNATRAGIDDTPYIVGMLVLIGGLAYGAHLAGLSPQWIAVGVIVLLGLGIVKAVARTRRPDPPTH